MRLAGMNAVVTGATSGIGRAVVEAFAHEGARLLLTGRKPELPEQRPEDRYVSGDLRDEDFVQRLAALAREHFGSLDVLVIGHGQQFDALLTDTSMEDATTVLESNLLSAFLVMKHMVPLMSERGGSVICVSSRLGIVGKPEQTLYSAAKGGLNMLARGAAIELAPRGVRVNVVAPGLTATEVIEASFQRRPDPQAYRREREATIPLQRLATPEEVAAACTFFASPDSAYITGAVLPVDGGYTAF